MTIKGITLHTEDPDTGAPITFFQIVQYTVDERSRHCYPTLSGYVGESALDSGKNPMTSRSCSVAGIPPRGTDAKDWLYSRLIAAPAPIDPDDPESQLDEGGEFAGGEVVEEF